MRFGKILKYAEKTVEENLSILFMRFFSFDEAEKIIEKTTFNSLYEILLC